MWKKHWDKVLVDAVPPRDYRGCTLKLGMKDKRGEKFTITIPVDSATEIDNAISVTELSKKSVIETIQVIFPAK